MSGHAVVTLERTAPPATASAGADPLVQIDRAVLRYGQQTVLQDVTLSVAPGEIVTIVGPNGSGKSSLLRALVGATPLAKGQIRARPGLRIGYVPQRLHVDPTLPLSVDRFLRLPSSNARPAAKTACQSALARAGVGDLGARQLADLSGGQMQRVLLARAMLGAPHLLLLDEPTQGLDQPGSAAFYRLIEEIRRDMGCAVLMVSHELHVVMAASDRVICLNGHICCQGTPEVVRSAPEYRALFGMGTGGALALYRHEHDHDHEHTHDHGHDHGPDGACAHAPSDIETAE